MANFDPKTVTPIEWTGIGAGAAAFLFSFFPWISLGFLGGFSAWNAGFLAWFPVLLLIGAGVVVLLPHLGTEVRNRTMLWLGLSGAAAVLILLRWLTYGEFMGAAGIGLFLTLLAAGVSVAGAYLSFKAAKRPAA
ncbi:MULTISPECIES: hypothetical protein [Actinokineospora]|uniref:Uncharacterized protein n=1 Tax=Actinokineospora fastidiosa TaxID=1816 RepID=A0A918GP11_9PSEU|nr:MULTISPECIES: hypothetical protein [Actinokineospora]UVS81153.1 hypothetical protein Actkin_04908 [Actinokineospora sp. UTMC 2448]GGS51607.1 hypothetical protein GCM10010171_53330 [Actinokineospora fastidiosa]